MPGSSMRPTAPPSLSIQVHGSSFVFDPSPHGVTIGAHETSHLRFLQDPEVARHHGTLEHTLVHGHWIYVDHSTTGSIINHTQVVLNDAAIVHDGDHFLVGRTPFVVHFHTPAKHSSPIRHMPSTPPARHLVRKTSVPMLLPTYTNSPIPKHKQQQYDQHLHQGASPPAKATGAYPFDVTPQSTPPNSSTFLDGYHATPLTPPPQRDNLRIQISKKMANRIIHMPLSQRNDSTIRPEAVMSPVPQSELRHRQQRLQQELARKTTEDAWLHEQQHAFRLQAAPSSMSTSMTEHLTSARRKSFTLDLVDPQNRRHVVQPPPRQAEHQRQEDVDATSSVTSSVPTELARYRDSVDLSSSSSDGEVEGEDSVVTMSTTPPTNCRSLDVSHLRQSFDALLNTSPSTWRPNPPPDDDHRSGGMRLKRAHLIKTAPMTRPSPFMLATTALHSPYKTAKHVNAFMEAAVSSPTHFDYATS
ncbi:hypothetical protein H310_10589 [Aphanomyces invadans]|uniref:FHA domain-containing protein n=1 Tax=Aphanomyces invadans TaxID=157072 RepID=A0A024TPJ8_9STRA|nr:hypothetical protein H310_10589 [Aphanomyces invadans]ETV95928.1 hypothetical protein H310_10589 [Aphanomyces invadans]|eukprot:XP_008875239.1 hypothetical protein H310_10589 [Aphanomyces invadans]